VLKQFSGVPGLMVPRDSHERRLWMGLSLTAGLCEEVLYRGFLIWYLRMLLPGMAAVLLAAIVFGVAHRYLGVGWSGCCGRDRGCSSGRGVSGHGDTLGADCTARDTGCHERPYGQCRIRASRARRGPRPDRGSRTDECPGMTTQQQHAADGALAPPLIFSTALSLFMPSLLSISFREPLIPNDLSKYLKSI